MYIKKLLLAPRESTDVLSRWNFAWIWQTICVIQGAASPHYNLLMEHTRQAIGPLKHRRLGKDTAYNASPIKSFTFSKPFQIRERHDKNDPK